MSNMSYCRFENTYADLLDCQNFLCEFGNFEDMDLSPTEAKYRDKLIELCHGIADDWEE